MPLEMRRTSKWWYGRFKLDGKVRCVNLRLEVEGERPESITQDGNGEFERSRGKAQEKLDEMVAELKEKQQAQVYVQRMHVIRTGRRISEIAVGALATSWVKAPRKRTGSKDYTEWATRLLKGFSQFMIAHYPGAETLADVTPEVAEDFMARVKADGVSGRTWNSKLVLLRSAFKLLAAKAGLALNPFEGMRTESEETVHRQPFSQEELEAIVAAAQQDEFIRPIIVTGMCTAMRRGDCCRLRWTDVDLKEGFVRVKTSKTGETVEIPMFPLLRRELERHVGNGSEFVFPEQEKRFSENSQSISYRVRKVLEGAGFYDVDEDDEAGRDCGGKRLTSEADLDRVLAAIADMRPEKRERVGEIVRRYVGGEKLPDIAQMLGMPKSTASQYVREAADLAGMEIIRPKRKWALGARRAGVSISRKGTARRLSVRDFHSFRVTWITMALSAGVPLELVQRVTGHRTTEIVLKHYFRPGREAFRRAIEGAMPKLLTEPAGRGAELSGAGGDVVVDDPVAALSGALVGLDGMTGRNWRQRRDEAVELIRQARRWCEGMVDARRADQNGYSPLVSGVGVSV